MLPPEAIAEYQQLVKLHFGTDISLEEATDNANKLVRFIMAIETEMTMENDYEELYDGSKRTI